MRSLLLIFWITVLFSATFLSAAGKRLAIMQLKGENVPGYIPKIVTDCLLTEISKLGIFTIIEINQRDRILKEQGKSLSECTDEKCAIKIGRLLSAEYVMFGQVGKLGSTFVVTVNIIDLETAKHEHDDNSRCVGEDGLPKLTEKLAAKIGLKYGIKPIKPLIEEEESPVVKQKTEKKRSLLRNITKKTLTYGGITSLVLSGVGLVFTLKFHDEYKRADNAQEEAERWDDLNTNQNRTIGLFWGGTIGFGLSLFF